MIYYNYQLIIIYAEVKMQIGSKFTIGVHIITAIDYFKDMGRVNSEFLAGSIGVNPVIVRTVISQV
jgi:DNA-binding IscR family transcriptional regulator